MANDLTKVIPQLLAQGMLALRQMAIMPRLVNSSYSTEAGKKGSTIDVPIPSAIAAVEVAPANVPPTTADSTPTSVAIPMDQWWEAPFYLTDKDVLQCMDGTIPMEASEAIKAIANKVDIYLLGLYIDLYGWYGTAGTTPFADGTTKDATGARKILHKQLAPPQDRRVVLDPDAEANALNIRAFQDASWSGDVEAILNGNLNRKLGFQWFMDQNVFTHTAGTITTGLIAKASTAVAVGLKTLLATTAASTGACALKKGDIISFAGDTQTYVLTANATQASAATDVTLAFEPGLAVAKVGSEAITVKATHVINMAFHRDCFAFASRPLLDIDANGLGAILESVVDPVSGLTLRLEVRREHKRTRFSYDMLWGGATVRREFGMRMGGTPAS